MYCVLKIVDNIPQNVIHVGDNFENAKSAFIDAVKDESPHEYGPEQIEFIVSEGHEVFDNTSICLLDLEGHACL